MGDRIDRDPASADAGERGSRAADLRSRWGLLATILTAAVPLILLVAYVGWRDHQQDEQLDALAYALQLEQEDRRAKGEEPVAPSVDELLANPELRGPKGDTGATGRGIASAECGPAGRWIVRYTDGTVDYAAGPCTGDRGPAGPSGEPGKDGADGQSITGPQGPAGASGADGRGIASARCDEQSGRWVITYTDDTTSDGGECIWRPGPDPSSS